MSLRVLHIGAGNLYGGIEAVLITLARHRAECADLTQMFACFFPGRLRDELREAGVNPGDLGPVRLSRPWTVIWARRHLATFLQTHAIEVVVCHAPWTFGICAPVVRAAKLPLVLWAHGAPAGNLLERWAARTQPDLLIANSQYTAGLMQPVFSRSPIKVIHCPVAKGSVSAGTRDRLRRELGVEEDTVVILQVSRMEELKGHRLHLRALHELMDVPGWQCWIAGDAQRAEEKQYAAAIQAMASDLGLGTRVRFLGRALDTPALMTAADVFCQPNQAPDAFGVVFVEALWAGIPVISTALGGAKEIIDETCGRLARPGDVLHLAECLCEMIVDSHARRWVKKAGPARAHSISDPSGRSGQLREALMSLRPEVSQRAPYLSVSGQPQ